MMISIIIYSVIGATILVTIGIVLGWGWYAKKKGKTFSEGVDEMSEFLAIIIPALIMIIICVTVCIGALE